KDGSTARTAKESKDGSTARTAKESKDGSTARTSAEAGGAPSARRSSAARADDNPSEPRAAAADARAARDSPTSETTEHSDRTLDEGSADDPSIAAMASAVPEDPWWRREDSKLHEVTIDTLRSEADDVLAQRMVEGFYVALDKTFRWNNRLWYKTTKGLVAPADRFWQVAGPEFKGSELDGVAMKLPVGWVYGSRKSASTYVLAEGTERLSPKGSVPSFTGVPLKEEPRKIAGTLYWQTTEGQWIKDAHLRVATQSEGPKDIGPNERWVDINVTSQTLVAYVGHHPVYATLVSSGKESKVKDKDHRTPRGEWRIREKHVTTTMDGDGTAAGDLPYSIEDVPYVAYFHRSYALHGAFWHKNYGVRMSHGCVNLAPLDAKYLYFFTEPRVPPGWHGVFATPDRPGSRVVVHE
ncbi:MAG: L,D-transpeptidase, partial [Polyangiaceae bacterium]|nr:L,D-transpeptidase [Polyangiaceae bacterium]